MKNRNIVDLYTSLCGRRRHFPLSGQIELTYRCDLNCVHCYCKGSEDRNSELSGHELKKILREIRKEGCLWICFTGGEPLIRDDFLEIYSYAKSIGFIVDIFTGGQAFTDEIINCLVKLPPATIEITLNAITENTYEAITGVDGSFGRVMANIIKLKNNNLPLVLKSNLMKQNKHELGKIKAFADVLFGKSPADSKRKYRFKYDQMIYPRLNGDKTPCRHRLSFEELLQSKRQDPDIWSEYRAGMHNDLPELRREPDFLYSCNTWMRSFFINPYGLLKFCEFSDKFGVDLRIGSFREGFYGLLPKITEEKFKTNSKCRNCSLRPLCYFCPPRMKLETGNEESPVEYYCQMTNASAESIVANKA